MKHETRQARAAMRRDHIWLLLWQAADSHDGWATMKQVYAYWLDGRSIEGIAWAEGYIGPSEHVSYQLRRLVADGRVERRKRPGKHPEYRVLVACDAVPTATTICVSTNEGASMEQVPERESAPPEQVPGQPVPVQPVPPSIPVEPAPSAPPAEPAPGVDPTPVEVPDPPAQPTQPGQQ